MQKSIVFMDESTAVRGADPSDFGFPEAQSTMPNMQVSLIGGNKLTPHLAEHHWLHIQNRFIQNKKLLATSPLRKSLLWIAKTNFRHIQKAKMPLSYRLRSALAEFRFYRALSDLKQKLLRR